jgi:hypothetical protein
MKTYPLRPKRNTHIWLGFPRLLSVQTCKCRYASLLWPSGDGCDMDLSPVRGGLRFHSLGLKFGGAALGWWWWHLVQ